MTIIGHDVVGEGPIRIILLHDWISDTTSWDMCRPLLDGERSSWAFVDLRGYGRSRAIPGEHTVTEAAADVMIVADTLGWTKFAVVGHSMSSLIALHLGQIFPERISRIVVAAPPPPAGLGVDEPTFDYLESVALGDHAQRIAGFEAMWGDRLSHQWKIFKEARWRETADPQAAAGFVEMFARQGLPDRQRPVSVPVLALTGECDAEIMRAQAVRESLAPLCPDLLVEKIAEAGHYPMQEAPPLTYTLIERFLASG